MHKLKYFLALFVLILATGAGCGVDVSNAPPQMQEPYEEVEVGGEWEEVDEGVERMEYYFETRRSAKVVLYRFNQDKFEWKLENGEEAHFVSEWAEEFADAVLVVNGMYFHEDLQPSGVFIHDGENVGDRAFDYHKSGIISFSPEVEIIDTRPEDFDDEVDDPEDIEVDLSKYTEAAQSYPFFIKAGERAIEKDSGYKAKRTFIGLDGDGLVYIGIIPDRAISLYEFMIVLDDMPIEWADVINLDGGPSTGLVTNFRDVQESEDSFEEVPNVVIVSRKENTP